MAPGRGVFLLLDSIPPPADVDEGAGGQTGRVPPRGGAVRSDGDKRAAHPQRAAPNGLDNLCIGRNRRGEQQKSRAAQSTPILEPITFANQNMPIVSRDQLSAPAVSHPCSLLARASGILYAPRTTFEALSAAPRALGVITLNLFSSLLGVPR